LTVLREFCMKKYQYTAMVRSFFTSIFQSISRPVVFYAVLLCIVASVVFSIRFDQPNGLFWDENYHIASAQKYREGVFFLEPHPPLGKMILAAGEQLFSLNNTLDTSTFIQTDKIDNVPDGFSFIGVRLPSVLAAIFSVLLLYAIGVVITKNAHAAFVGGSLLLFDNAFVVHSRGAMLESIQIMFMLSAILIASFMLVKHKKSILWYSFLGILIGLVLSVKVNSLILILLIPAVFISHFFHFFVFVKSQNQSQNQSQNESEHKIQDEIEITQSYSQKKNSFIYLIQLFIQFFLKSVWAFFLIMVVFVGIQGAHAAIAHNPYQGKLYDTSVEYQTLLSTNPLYSPRVWVATTVEWYRYNQHYQEGVPAYDATKPGENGSLPFMWPAGGKTIAYRWGKMAVQKETGQYISFDDYSALPAADKNEYELKAQYLYLVPNPVGWFISLFSILALLGLLAMQMVRKPLSFFQDPLNVFGVTVVAMWLGYMVAVSYIPRVMYLYHYFIPLVFGFIAFFLVFKILSNQFSKQSEFFLSALFCVLVLSFLWYAPFTYFIPLSKHDVDIRNFFPIWRIQSVV